MIPLLILLSFVLGSGWFICACMLRLERKVCRAWVDAAGIWQAAFGECEGALNKVIKACHETIENHNGAVANLRAIITFQNNMIEVQRRHIVLIATGNDDGPVEQKPN